MNNYKIKVNNTNPKEYQEVLDIAAELGYDNEDWGNLYNLNYLFLNDDSSVGFSLNGEAVSDDYQELTLPQLRDLVVLHRNDVNDANYKSHIDFYYVTDMHDYYFWNGHKWCESTQESIEGLTEIKSNSSEQGLISGADALKAMMEGKRVLYSGYKNQDWDTALNCNLGVFLKHEKFPDFSFKIVPRTIKLEIEIPACGENYKHGQLIWILNSLEPNEYCSVILDESDELPAYWWETEEEIKQVVAALRGGIKG